MSDRHVDHVLQRTIRQIQLHCPRLYRHLEGKKSVSVAVLTLGQTRRERVAPRETSAFDSHVPSLGEHSVDNTHVSQGGVAKLLPFSPRQMFPFWQSGIHRYQNQGVSLDYHQPGDEMAAHAEAAEEQGEIQARPFAGAPQDFVGVRTSCCDWSGWYFSGV